MGAPPALLMPIVGMSCAACATRLEKVLNRQPGLSASVNFATARARLESAPGQPVEGEAVLAAIRKAGFAVAPDTLELALTGMSCAACAARIERIECRAVVLRGQLLPPGKLCFCRRCGCRRAFPRSFCRILSKVRRVRRKSAVWRLHSFGVFFQFVR